MLVGALAYRLRRHGGSGSARIALFGGKNACAMLGGLAAPSRLPVEHVHGIARRERCNRREPGIGETSQRLHSSAAARHVGYGTRLESQRVPHSALERREGRPGGPI